MLMNVEPPLKSIRTLAWSLSQTPKQRRLWKNVLCIRYEHDIVSTWVFFIGRSLSLHSLVAICVRVSGKKNKLAKTAAIKSSQPVVFVYLKAHQFTTCESAPMNFRSFAKHKTWQTMNYALRIYVAPIFHFEKIAWGHCSHSMFERCH